MDIVTRAKEIKPDQLQDVVKRESHNDVTRAELVKVAAADQGPSKLVHEPQTIADLQANRRAIDALAFSV